MPGGDITVLAPDTIKRYQTNPPKPPATVAPSASAPPPPAVSAPATSSAPGQAPAAAPATGNLLDRMNALDAADPPAPPKPVVPSAAPAPPGPAVAPKRTGALANIAAGSNDNIAAGHAGRVAAELSGSRLPTAHGWDVCACTFHPARSRSALRWRRSRVPFVPPTTARHAAASLLNGRSQTLPSGRTAL